MKSIRQIAKQISSIVKGPVSNDEASKISALFSNGGARLLIAETNTSMYNYHLRLVNAGEEKFSGGAGPALCGRTLGWDTKFPLSIYGKSDHMPSSYCAKCLEIAKEKNLWLND